MEHKEETGDLFLRKPAALSDLLHILGGGVVFIGICIFITSSWGELTVVARILSTFGMGVGTYLAGVLLIKEKKFEDVAQAFFLISALALPVGLFVLASSAGLLAFAPEIQVSVTGLLLLVYGLSFRILGRSLFLVFSILFATWLFHALLSLLLERGGVYIQDLAFYELLAVGLSYLALGRHFTVVEKYARLTGLLYSLGIFFFLAATFALTNPSVGGSRVWEILFPGFAFVTIFLSTVLKNRSFLIWGSIFFVIYIIKVSAQYFGGAVGWPLALVLLGFFLIGSGHYTALIGKRR
jgi:hypothetical protein